jgi:hypothetical protein
VRSIQDARKEADYDIADRIKIQITGDIAENIIKSYGAYIQEETLSTIINNMSSSDIQKSIEL